MTKVYTLPSLAEHRHAVAEARKVFEGVIAKNDAAWAAAVKDGQRDAFILAWPNGGLGVGYLANGTLGVVGIDVAFRFDPVADASHPLLTNTIRNGAGEAPELIDLGEALKINSDRLRGFIASLEKALADREASEAREIDAKVYGEPRPEDEV
jgi:hypothetical protein